MQQTAYELTSPFFGIITNFSAENCWFVTCIQLLVSIPNFVHCLVTKNHASSYFLSTFKKQYLGVREKHRYISKHPKCEPFYDIMSINTDFRQMVQNSTTFEILEQKIAEHMRHNQYFEHIFIGDESLHGILMRTKNIDVIKVLLTDMDDDLRKHLALDIERLPASVNTGNIARLYNALVSARQEDNNDMFKILIEDVLSNTDVGSLCLFRDGCPSNFMIEKSYLCPSCKSWIKPINPQNRPEIFATYSMIDLLPGDESPPLNSGEFMKWITCHNKPTNTTFGNEEDIYPERFGHTVGCIFTKSKHGGVTYTVARHEMTHAPLTLIFNLIDEIKHMMPHEIYINTEIGRLTYEMACVLFREETSDGGGHFTVGCIRNQHGDEYPTRSTFIIDGSKFRHENENLPVVAKRYRNVIVVYNLISSTI